MSLSVLELWVSNNFEFWATGPTDTSPITATLGMGPDNVFSPRAARAASQALVASGERSCKSRVSYSCSPDRSADQLKLSVKSGETTRFPVTDFLPTRCIFRAL